MPILGDFRLIEPTTQLVWGGPYSRSFWASERFVGGPTFLMMSVLTRYDSNSRGASVRINGTEIGTVDARPWTNHFEMPMYPMTFNFSSSLLSSSGTSTLQIIPKDQPTDYLFVDNIVCFFREIT